MWSWRQKYAPAITQLAMWTTILALGAVGHHFWPDVIHGHLLAIWGVLGLVSFVVQCVVLL